MRMRFRGVDGQPATVIRSLRLAALANHKLKLNTLDATLVTYDSQGNVRSLQSNLIKCINVRRSST